MKDGLTIDENGYEEWFIEDKEMTKEEFNLYTKNK